MAASYIHPLGRLLGGEWESESDLGTIIQHLADSLTEIVDQVGRLDFAAEANPQVPLLAPYLARGILEVGFAILLARLDPFRVLVLRKVQQSPDFQIALRNNCALQWKGDFVAEEKVTDPWKTSRKPKEMTRALLGDYNDHVFWQPSFVRLLDEVPEDRGGQWMANLRLISADGFTPRMRGQAERAYSACSKGVHHEFVIPLSAYYDSQETVELIRQVTEVVSILGLVLNFNDHMPFCTPRGQALDRFEEVQEQMQVINA